MKPRYYFILILTLMEACLLSELTLAAQSPIDLGLSVKWCNCNLGAANQEGFGDYYAWGEITPKISYNWSSYKWSNGDKGVIKYSTDPEFGYNGFVDDKNSLDVVDDVAHCVLGGRWRIPSKEEWKELNEECIWTWTTVNGVSGYVITSDKTGNSIFLPVAGGKHDTSVSESGSRGYYWSSTLEKSYFSKYAYCFYFTWTYRTKADPQYRYYGFPIRAVTD